ncbi:MAG: hypothetical protein KDA86_14620 [Planctomycetaceae bacterium]|nr:hypothetical protein [Planctomycetaceae bacterium]MCA9112721.1 hypothetical protein [Planctomycetaceae bacterium]
MVQRTFGDYQRITDRHIKVFGKNRVVSDLQPKDFAALRTEISKTNGLVALNGEVNTTKVVVNFAIKNQPVDQIVIWCLYPSATTSCRMMSHP